MSKFAIFYTVLAAFIIGWYTWSTATGMEYFHPGKEQVTEKERQSGYRGHTFILIHSGYRGGK